MGLTYKDAGVDIDAGEALIAKIKPLAARTMRPEVRGGIGGFAGLCAIPEGYRRPLLVSGTDGVGTKLKTAFETGRHDTIGIDLVAMAVNDVAVIGAEPLFFLDYFAAGKLASLDAEAVIRGVAEGCQQAGCALLGGETAELPGMYRDGEYELAGFCVGVVEADDIRDGKEITAGDVVIGLASSGLHSNGHSLARKVVLETLGLGHGDAPAELEGATVADELLRPTRIYVRALAALSRAGVRFKGAAHITGGGLIDNPPRMLPAGELAVVLREGSWEVPPIFRLIASAGIEEHEMRRTFNLGLGMLIACAEKDADAALAALAQAGEEAAVVGHLAPAEGGEAVRFA
jgi:phosphoribosylformylglycinamidine cyclo-ligase